MEQISNRQDFKGLYSPQFEHDNCGIGAVVNINGIKTHDTVANALTIVETLEHRAGKDAEGKTGDGVGILLQISHKFFKKVAQRDLGIKLLAERDYAVGMFFFPQNELARNQAKKMFEIIAEKEERQQALCQNSRQACHKAPRDTHLKPWHFLYPFFQYSRAEY